MIRALVITHGDIGRELVRVTEMILGPTEGLTSMTNMAKSATTITDEIRDWLISPPETDKGPDQKLILLDDFGGSCATSAQLACGDDPDAAIIAGVNLAMLLGFVTWRDTGVFSELVAKTVQKGREAIVQVGGR